MISEIPTVKGGREAVTVIGLGAMGSVLAGATAVVTRDRSGFSGGTLRVYGPETRLAVLDAS